MDQVFTQQAPGAQPPTVRPRLASIDYLRGIVMVVMALDHTRDYFSNARADLMNTATLLSQGDAALFLTRWITHFCAPVFVFLAGTSAYLACKRGKTRAQTAAFLATRGVWLVVLELTLVHFGWEFDFDFHFEVLQVIWAIGCSMIVLAGLVFLPLWAIAAFGLALICGHNLFDAVRPESLGPWGGLWTVLHRPGLIQPVPGVRAFVAYPLVPWIGVMATGYVFGQVMLLENALRRRWLLVLGSALTAAFVVLRATNLYGDPHPWTLQKDWLWTIFSFLNCEKYPPSLLYLLMTLGPALLLLALLEKETSPVSRVFVLFGRVPLFYYLLHLPLIHGLSLAVAVARYGPRALSFGEQGNSVPTDAGFALPVVYLIWLGIVLLLFPLCAWFADIKRRRRDPWLSYL
ncbi:DUF1624 domain-containing protein [Gloeobacter kilaueensis]|uniref:Heparan-alpha-glucosaminide N-acetyltransferase catalytic domain-containing protein n=1 Tax=Gloeobacter kilaueensis (strain ATCC BAA-2537 / CCAP 1431/1 / ULC 316 / JS1) TaxID=1183438 RepID=U5QML6_GLOK1|nr:heparan-alpha-glucosaminide N-acetyltransferase domain-containing protein [Gloeobacter kilaueensis]AGY58895.1 hypothetical protein GKIL_2649 [Gloeobacter kilaueensis JS1]